MLSLPTKTGVPLRRPGLCFGIGYAALLLVAVMSLIPSPDIGGSDKLLHLVTYAGLSAGYALLVREPGNLLLVAVGLVGYGILLELLQGMTGYRMLDGWDVLANAAGVVVGLMVWLTPLPLLFRRIENRLG